MSSNTGSHSAAIGLQKAPVKQFKKETRGGVSLSFWFLVAALLFAAWAAGKQGIYTPGSELGYNLGLVGGIMMLLLLLYSFSKRIRILRSIIPIKYWFMFHMTMGVLGPVLIVFHSTLQFGSINGAIAFASMTAVFLSGVIGRFIYTKIHHGLYGRKTSLDELRNNLSESSGSLHEQLVMFPIVEKYIHHFENKLIKNPDHVIQILMVMLTMHFRASNLYWKVNRKLIKAVKKRARENEWSKKERNLVYKLSDAAIQEYIKAVLSVAQLRLYERVFSWWHILHVPLMIVLVLSAVIHVLAVHMY